MRRLPHIAALLAVLCFMVHTRIIAAEDKPRDTVKILESKDFWGTAGKKGGRKWAALERKQLEELKSSSRNARLRLRANKILVDLAGNARYREEDEAAVVAGFHYLEDNLQIKPIQKLVEKQGFTHYTVSMKNEGTQWFLIEHVELKGFNGGVNLKVDEEAITEMKSWARSPLPNSNSSLEAVFLARRVSGLRWP